ncbi:hypothetical protein COOONC_27802 [Cooperia oncophora]
MNRRDSCDNAVTHCNMILCQTGALQVAYDEDRQWMVGNALLVKPIVEPRPVQASLYLPGKREIWYDWETSKARPSPGAVQSPATLTSIPLYQRGACKTIP